MKLFSFLGSCQAIVSGAEDLVTGRASALLRLRVTAIVYTKVRKQHFKVKPL